MRSDTDDAVPDGRGPRRGEQALLRPGCEQKINSMPKRLSRGSGLSPVIVGRKVWLRQPKIRKITKALRWVAAARLLL